MHFLNRISQLFLNLVIYLQIILLLVNNSYYYYCVHAGIFNLS